MVTNEYSKDSNVIYAEPNYVYQTCLTPNDPDFCLQYYLNNSGQTGGTFDADIDGPEAWDIETGDENIVIAIHDTGVDYDHPDLEDNIWINSGEDINGNGEVDSSDFNGIDDDYNGFIDDIRGWDFVNTTKPVAPGEDGTVRDNDPMDFHGHGTHCSGIASAVSDNSIGITGVCWDCSIMPIRIGFKSTGGAGLIDIEGAAAGLEYGADNGAHVISMSWGGTQITSLIWDAVNYSYSKGVILVAAAGNIGNGVEHYPASYPDVIAVAATDHNDEIAHTAFESNHGSWVDVAAAGEFVYSTLFNDTYCQMSGTSMATPQVAALAALILSKNPSFSQKEVWTIIRSTTDDVISEKYIGTGRINAYKAIQRDSTPIAEISYILDNAIVACNVTIPGTACGSTFVNYSLYYGVGNYPENWTFIDESNTPVNDGTLAIWSSPEPDEELRYSIKLLVYDTSGKISEDRVRVFLDVKPTPPSIVGKENGVAGKTYYYTFNSTDPDEDDIYYYVDWGDGTFEDWFGPFESGKKTTCTHVWEKTGTYLLKVKAKDTYGAESDWAELTVTMPRNKAIYNSFIIQILEKIANSFPILKYLLGL